MDGLSSSQKKFVETVDRVTQVFDRIPQVVLEKSQARQTQGGPLPLFWMSANRIQACALALRSDAGSLCWKTFQR